ncbi:uncharacterized protein MCYG_08057 [Microsporum canis CBS 113480]|uniref:Uncharacterized protein n=1 Tax=Arthroderma otae (strain ATCC MYA-4605 / CBS 113480) TaxID=554155 RepID=C5FZD5_ARTOC|nr:uncharacterized protein MCYG_08057 [Microsporum canis CBS 113480]EEQ35238.1 predicted protein [Microsporum canis CBS 113480]
MAQKDMRRADLGMLLPAPISERDRLSTNLVPYEAPPVKKTDGDISDNRAVYLLFNVYHANGCCKIHPSSKYLDAAVLTAWIDVYSKQACLAQVPTSRPDAILL